MERNEPNLDQLLTRVRKLLDIIPDTPQTTRLPDTSQPRFEATIHDSGLDGTNDNEEYSPPSSIASSPWASPRQTALDLPGADLPLTKPPVPQTISSTPVLVGATLLENNVNEVVVSGEHLDDVFESTSSTLESVTLIELEHLSALDGAEHCGCDDSDDDEESSEEDEDEDGAYGDAEDSPPSSNPPSPSSSPVKPRFAFPFHEYTEAKDSLASSPVSKNRRTLDDTDLETKAGVFRHTFSTQTTVGLAVTNMRSKARGSRIRARGASTSATTAPTATTQEKHPRKWQSAPNLKPGLSKFSTRNVTTILTKPVTTTTPNDKVNGAVSRGSDSSSSSSEASGSTTAEGTLSTVSTCSGVKVVYKIRHPSAAGTRRRGQVVDGLPVF